MRALADGCDPRGEVIIGRTEGHEPRESRQRCADGVECAPPCEILDMRGEDLRIFSSNLLVLLVERLTQLTGARQDLLQDEQLASYDRHALVLCVTRGAFGRSHAQIVLKCPRVERKLLLHGCGVSGGITGRTKRADIHVQRCMRAELQPGLVRMVGSGWGRNPIEIRRGLFVSQSGHRRNGLQQIILVCGEPLHGGFEVDTAPECLTDASAR